MRQGLAEHNPVVGTEAPEKPTAAARVLKPVELVAIWIACEHMGDFGGIVRLLMLLGQRRLEVAAIAWSEIDLGRKLWIIPGGRTKNGREHEVPLPDQALALLPERCSGRDLLFGRGDRAFSGFSQAKAKLDEATGALEPWHLHCLRHSFVTYANEIGIDPHVIEAAINHASGFRGGIAGRYNAAKYREQKRAAMTRYADWLGQLVSGEQPAGNVVAFA
jgi:integrase